MPKLRHRTIDPKVVYSKTIVDINSILGPSFTVGRMSVLRLVYLFRLYVWQPIR